MSCRRYGSKPTVAFWMLVALADIALILASAGTVTLVVFLLVAATFGAGWKIARRATAGRQVLASSVASRTHTGRSA